MKKIFMISAILLVFTMSTNLYSYCLYNFSDCYIYAYYRHSNQKTYQYESKKCLDLKAYIWQNNRWKPITLKHSRYPREAFITLRINQSFRIKVEGCGKKAEITHFVKCKWKQRIPALSLY